MDYLSTRRDEFEKSRYVFMTSVSGEGLRADRRYLTRVGEHASLLPLLERRGEGAPGEEPERENEGKY